MLPRKEAFGANIFVQCVRMGRISLVASLQFTCDTRPIPGDESNLIIETASCVRASSV